MTAPFAFLLGVLAGVALVVIVAALVLFAISRLRAEDEDFQ